MDCPFCGKEIRDGAMVCNNCGKVIDYSRTGLIQKTLVNDHLKEALYLLKKRKYKYALQECDAAIKNNPELEIAKTLRNVIQDKKNLQSRGLFSIFFGIMLYQSLMSAVSNSGGELTSLGSIAFCLAILLILEGLVVALTGLTIGFLIDGITICIVGAWNLGTSLFVGETNLLFAGLGVFQLVWGVLGISGYFKKIKINLNEIENQIFGSSYATIENVSTELAKKLKEASVAYESGKNPKRTLQLCDEILQIEPGLPVAYNLKGMVLEELERNEEAIRAYQEAIKLDPLLIDAKDNLSELELRLRK
jgi:tetratricopeptide (TPR) repeat protein